jgi:nucleolin
MAKSDKKAKKEKNDSKDAESDKVEPEDGNNASTDDAEVPKKKRGFEKLSELDKKQATSAADEDDDDGDEPTGETEEAGAARKRKRNRSRKKKTPKEEEGESGGAAEKSPMVEGTVYVEGISYDADDSDVITFFEQVGKVSSLRMPRWHDSGKPRGYAHVVFADSAHVPLAMKQLNNQRLMGRYLKVALPNAPKVVGGGPKSEAPEGENNEEDPFYMCCTYMICICLIIYFVSVLLSQVVELYS